MGESRQKDLGYRSVKHYGSASVIGIAVGFDSQCTPTNLLYRQIFLESLVL